MAAHFYGPFSYHCVIDEFALFSLIDFGTVTGATTIDAIEFFFVHVIKIFLVLALFSCCSLEWVEQSF